VRACDTSASAPVGCESFGFIQLASGYHHCLLFKRTQAQMGTALAGVLLPWGQQGRQLLAPEAHPLARDPTACCSEGPSAPGKGSSAGCPCHRPPCHARVGS